MTHFRLCLMFVVLSTAGFLLSLNGCGGTAKSLSITPQPIEHVVVIFQENRTPDNLFQDPVLIGRGADIKSSGLNSKQLTIPLSPIDLATDYDIGHGHPAFNAMYDGGKMDGADLIPISCAIGAQNCPPPNPQFKSVNPSEVLPYFQLAEQYTFGDRMFQTNQGPSFPAHQFIISGTVGAHRHQQSVRVVESEHRRNRGVHRAPRRDGPDGRPDGRAVIETVPLF